MNAVHFIKEPGYIYDLFFLFVFNFNKEKYIKDFKQFNYNAASCDTITSDFGPFCSELLPFFWQKEDNKCFMTQFYYLPYTADLFENYSLETVQKALSQYEKVVENMIRFYFPDITAAQVFDCKQSPVVVSRLIKQSHYSDTIKSSLYAFFIEPEEVIRKLSAELIVKDYLLSQQYERDLEVITDLQSRFEVDLLVDKLNRCDNQRIDVTSFNEVSVTFCLRMNYCMKVEFSAQKALFILGVNYSDALDAMIHGRCSLQIDLFGNVLSEQNRIEILELLLLKKELSIRDIEYALGFSGTNAYYHLSLMVKAKMISSRNQGRTILYSINRHTFNLMHNWILRYISSEKGDGTI